MCRVCCCFISFLVVIPGYLVRYWASILATSKAQQLLFRIIDCLLLPHALFQQDKGMPGAMLSAIRESLPLFLQVRLYNMLAQCSSMCVTSSAQNVFLLGSAQCGSASDSEILSVYFSVYGNYCSKKRNLIKL